MNTYVQEIDFLDQPAIKAGNDQLEVILVPSWGSNLISIRYKPKNIEILRVPKSSEEYRQSPMLYGTPILFPPNRIEGGVFTFNKKTYHLQINEPERQNHIHGFLYDKAWKHVHSSTTSRTIKLMTEFDSSQHPEVYDQFPHHFMIRMTYLIEGASISKKATIINKGKESFPWGFGYHTTVQFPFVPGTPIDKCFLSLDVSKRWQLNERLNPTGELEETDYLTKLQKRLCLQNRSFDDIFLSSQTDSNQAVLYDDNIGIRLSYQCDQNYKHWVIYNSDGEQGFLCPEPYTWVTNAPNLDLPPDLSGLQVLKPHEEVNLASKLEVMR